MIYTRHILGDRLINETGSHRCREHSWTEKIVREAAADEIDGVSLAMSCLLQAPFRMSLSRPLWQRLMSLFCCQPHWSNSGPTMYLSLSMAQQLLRTQCHQLCWKSWSKPIVVIFGTQLQSRLILWCSVSLSCGLVKTYFRTGAGFTDGKRHVVSPSVAVTLHGYIRIPEATLDEVLKASGPCGVPMWPKSPDRQNDPRCSHIPVGAQSFDEAAAVAQSTPHGVGFVHHNQKWLVRCHREHYPEVRQTLVPQGFVLETACIGTADKLFVLQAPNSDLSCTSKAINSGLEGIGWKASVVKSIGPAAWLIASTVDPPNPHVAMNNQIM